jgi:hypothetical protein
MKILLLGTGKSGTTALVYKLAGGLPNCQAFSGGRPGKYLGDYENAVYKHTYEESKGKSFELYREHLEKEHYDRKIWIARDPRDVAVSRMLYRWQRGTKGQKAQYQEHLQLVLQKENDPRSIPFYEICRHIGYNSWPISTEEVVEEERVRYRPMCDFVKSLGDDWFLFTYEDMLSANYDALNTYLGFNVQQDAEVPTSTGKAKVVRKKSIGDWRHWFTEEDVELFKPAYMPYMELMGYDFNDWALSSNPVIEPEYSSMYMQRLAQRKSSHAKLSFKDRIIKLFTKG